VTFKLFGTEGEASGLEFQRPSGEILRGEERGYVFFLSAKDPREWVKTHNVEDKSLVRQD